MSGWHSSSTAARLALVPVLVLVGTLGGVTLASRLLPDMQISRCVGRRGGIRVLQLVQRAYHPGTNDALGVVALLSNLIREIVTLLLAPVLCTFRQPGTHSLRGSDGDGYSTLPVIARFAGKEYSIVALFSGVVLTAAVPVLIL